MHYEAGVIPPFNWSERDAACAHAGPKRDRAANPDGKRGATDRDRYKDPTTTNSDSNNYAGATHLDAHPCADEHPHPCAAYLHRYA